MLRPPLHPENNRGTHFCRRLCRYQRHCAAGMINSSNTIGYRTLNLPTCSAVSQPTTPLRVLRRHKSQPKNTLDFQSVCGIKTQMLIFTCLLIGGGVAINFPKYVRSYDARQGHVLLLNFQVSSTHVSFLQYQQLITVGNDPIYLRLM